MGIFLLLLGLTIRMLAICSLKDNLTWRILPPNHLVSKGIYKYIRHPMYLGGLLDYSGLCLLLTKNFGITLIFFLLLLNFTLDRIDREEQYLFKIYKEKYSEYFKKTKMLIPFIY